MAGQYDHRERAEELVADITADPDRDRELTALAAVAEAVLAVADELAELRAVLASRRSLSPQVRASWQGVVRGTNRYWLRNVHKDPRV